MTTKDMVKITVNLVVIYVIGGLIMAFVYAKTSPIMFIKAKEEKEAALKLMMPAADKIATLGDWSPHEKHAEYYAAQKCGQRGHNIQTFPENKDKRLDQEYNHRPGIQPDIN